MIAILICAGIINGIGCWFLTPLLGGKITFGIFCLVASNILPICVFGKMVEDQLNRRKL